jgi:hypothetical protein
MVTQNDLLYASWHPSKIIANFHQKFKVRIEDPPRRRHMVFLGGAVLANIVSGHGPLLLPTDAS